MTNSNEYVNVNDTVILLEVQVHVVVLVDRTFNMCIYAQK
ncbi:MAG: hypothetical protein ACI8RD_003234 [Bacillariaceae sp.]|jgi:hypothetical protein